MSSTDKKRKAAPESNSPVKRHDRRVCSSVEDIPDISEGRVPYDYCYGDRNMTTEVAKTLGDLLPQKAVRRLLIREANIDNSMMAEIARGMKNHPQLEVVSLSGNGIGDPGAEEIATVLRSPGCRLRVLDLGQYNSISYGGFVAICKTLATARSTLVSLDLSWTYIGLVDVNSAWSADDISFAKYLGESRALRRLNLARTHLTSLRMEALLQSLFDHPTLVSLDISQNVVAFETDETMEALLALIRNSRLAELKVNYCDLGRYFWARFRHAMRKNHTLCSVKIKLQSGGDPEDNEVPLSEREQIARWICCERQEGDGLGIPLTIELVREEDD